MGLFDFMSSTPEKQLEKHLKKLKQVYAQSEYRRGAADALLKMATPEAYFALCKRFTVVANSAYWDEDEKKWMVDTLVDLGDDAIGPLKKFVLEIESVNYPLRALQRLLDDEAMTAFLVEALHARDPEDYRRDRGKMELIDHLGQRPVSDALIQAIVPYLHDHSDDVICKTVEVIEGWQREDQGAALFELVFDDTMSARVQRRTAEALVKMNIKSDKDLGPLPDAVAEDFAIDGRQLRSTRAAQEQA